MKVFIVFAAICFLAVAMAQEEDEEVNEAALRETRAAKGSLCLIHLILSKCMCISLQLIAVNTHCVV